MKIILTTASSSLDANIDPRFGRSAYLLIVDTGTLEWDALPNPGATASGGAGTQAAQSVAGYDVEAAISGDFGPNAFDALQAAGIAMYRYGDCTTARQALERFQAGQLQQIHASTGPGHHGREG